MTGLSAETMASTVRREELDFTHSFRRDVRQGLLLQVERVGLEISQRLLPIVVWRPIPQVSSSRKRFVLIQKAWLSRRKLLTKVVS